jgi:hypothetical protein
MIELDLGAILIGIGIGVLIAAVYVWYLWWSLARHIDTMVDQAVNNNFVGLDIELDQDRFFCYNNKNKEFVCQGNTVQEVRDAFARRYPGKTAYLAGGAPSAIMRFRTELLDLHLEERDGI